MLLPDIITFLLDLVRTDPTDDRRRFSGICPRDEREAHGDRCDHRQYAHKNRLAVYSCIHDPILCFSPRPCGVRESPFALPALSMHPKPKRQAHASSTTNTPVMLKQSTGLCLNDTMTIKHDIHMRTVQLEYLRSNVTDMEEPI